MPWTLIVLNTGVVPIYTFWNEWIDWPMRRPCEILSLDDLKILNRPSMASSVELGVLPLVVRHVRQLYSNHSRPGTE
jgi:hypothetical protein